MIDENTHVPVDRLYVYRDSAGEWRWRYTASNGQILAVSSEGYTDRDHCIEMLNRVVGPGARTLEIGSGDMVT